MEYSKFSEKKTLNQNFEENNKGHLPSSHMCKMFSNLIKLDIVYVKIFVTPDVLK